jgi:hypothetical protein
MSGRLCDVVKTVILSLYGWSPTCSRLTFTLGLAFSYALTMSTKYGAVAGSANFVMIDSVPDFVFGVVRLCCLVLVPPLPGVPQAVKAKLAATSAATAVLVRKSLFMTHPICRGVAEPESGSWWCRGRWRGRMRRIGRS